MAHFQPTFDALIASSLSALEQIDADQSQDQCCFKGDFRSQSKASSLQSSGSIDDFLVEYRHEDNTIVQFMKSLEEPDLMCDRADSWRSTEFHEDCIKAMLPNEGSKHVPSFHVDPKHVVACKGTSISADNKAGLIAKCLRVKPTAENALERRREKNREYQRRFRERKLCLELKKTLVRPPAACSIGFF
jgi:hypothetical protein